RIGRERARLALSMTEMTCGTGLRIEHVEAVLLRADPDAALRIDEQRARRIACERVRLERIVPESEKPRKIEIANTGTARAIEQKAA
ncbi:MAG: hypothetical protein WD075_03940, partial [Rhodospirillales bacterium]